MTVQELLAWGLLICLLLGIWFSPIVDAVEHVLLRLLAVDDMGCGVMDALFGQEVKKKQCGAPRAPATHDSERVAASNVTGRLIVGQNDHGEPFTGQVNRTVADVNGLSEALSTLRLTGRSSFLRLNKNVASSRCSGLEPRKDLSAMVNRLD